MKSYSWLFSVIFFNLAAMSSLAIVASAQSSQVQTFNQVPVTSTVSSVVDQLQDSFVNVAAKIKPCVVTIYTERQPKTVVPNQTPSPSNAPSIPNDSQASLGSGMVIDNQGHILTNYHVVKDALVIRVMGNSDTDFPPRPVATLIGYDQESDLAVLQVAPSSAFVPVQFGDSDNVRIGEWVLAVGAPFDQAQTVTVGVISAKERHLTTDGVLSLQNYLQTDAAINPGNSGGPLVNMQGKVIGINTAILSPSRYSVGIGFAVPSNTIDRLLPTLLQGKQVKRGFLGIRYLPLSPGVAAAFGVAGGMQIGALAQQDGKPYGPAFDTGLRQGDIITSINGRPVSTSEQFRGFVSKLIPGTVVQLDVLRPLQNDVHRQTFEITLGDRNADVAEETQPIAPPLLNLPRFGLGVENTRELSTSQRTLLGQPPDNSGKEENRVIIIHVRPGSSADYEQLQQGEIIEKICIAEYSVTGGYKLGAWQTIADKTQMINALPDLPSHSKVLVQLKDKQGIVLYKILTPTVPSAP